MVLGVDVRVESPSESKCRGRLTVRNPTGIHVQVTRAWVQAVAGSGLTRPEMTDGPTLPARLEAHSSLTWHFDARNLEAGNGNAIEGGSRRLFESGLTDFVCARSPAAPANDSGPLQPSR